MVTLDHVAPAEWIDFNGHVRDAYYMLVISWGNDALHDALGVGPDYRAQTGRTVYNVDSRIRFLKEAREGDRMRLTLRILDADDRRCHTHAVLAGGADGDPMAVCESVLIHVDQSGPRAAPYPAEAQTRIAAMIAEDGPPPTLRAPGVGLRART